MATRDTRGTRTDYIYDDTGRRVSVVQAVGTELASQSYTCYDKAGRVRRTIANYVANGNDPDAWQADAVETWLFVQSTHRYREDNLIATISYDAASRRQSSTSPMGNTQAMAYDVAGRVVEVTDARGVITHYSYDGLGRRKQVVQNRTASNPESWLWNDTLSQWEDGVTNAIAHGTNNDENIIVQVTYDVMGRVLTMRNPLGNVTTYAYDGLGRRTSLSNPLGLAWTTAYTDVGNTTQTTQRYPGANDSTEYDVTRTFDRMGRLTGIQYGDTASTPDVALEYDLAGNRSRMSETDSTTTIQRDYAYDSMNRLKTAGESGAQVNYTYDAGGLRTQMTLPDGLSLDYAYDAKGQLISMTDWDGGKSTFRYDTLGRHTRTYRPNTMQSRYRYDADGRLRDLRHRQGDETLAQFQYDVDANGNRTEAREYLMPASTGNATQTYAYNHPDITFPHGTWTDEGHFKVADGWASWLKVRLVANSIAFTYGTGPDHSLFDVYVGGSLWQSVDGYATERGEATLTIPLRYDGPLDFEIRNREEKNLQSTGYVVRFKQVQATSKLSSHNISYTYDGLARLLLADYGATQYQYGFDVAGNLVNMNGTSRTFNTANQMTHDGTNTLTYDANGNMTSDGVNAYTWDRANRLLSHGGLSYAYDGMGNRVSQDNGTDVTNYLLDTQPSLAKVIGANQERYSHDMHGVHAMYDGSAWNYYMQDGLGSVRGVTDMSATVQQSVNYSEYGVPDTTMTGFAFTGEQRDGNGLQYHRARYMNPNMGGFLSLDPFEGVHSRPMSLNGYSWVEGNVPNYADASGLQSGSSTNLFGEITEGGGGGAITIPPQFIADAVAVMIGGAVATQGVLDPPRTLTPEEIVELCNGCLSDLSLFALLSSLGVLVSEAIKVIDKIRGKQFHIAFGTNNTLINFTDNLNRTVSSNVIVMPYIEWRDNGLLDNMPELDDNWDQVIDNTTGFSVTFDFVIGLLVTDVIKRAHFNLEGLSPPFAGSDTVQNVIDYVNGKGVQGIMDEITLDRFALTTAELWRIAHNPVACRKTDFYKSGSYSINMGKISSADKLRLCNPANYN